MSYGLCADCGALSFVLTMETVDVNDVTCSMCHKTFTLKKSLYKHLRNIHKIEPLDKLSKPFQCENCEKQFSSKSNLLHHSKKFHKSVPDHNYLEVPKRKTRLICSIQPCDEEFTNQKEYRAHLQNQHELEIDMEELCFESMQDFEKWKDQIQQKTLTTYTKDTGIKSLKSGVTRIFYNCHRSYSYQSKGKNIRAMKSTGTNKIGKACPSRLEVTSTVSDDGEPIVSVKYWKTHCGHTEELGKITLNRDIRLEIAGKLKEGVSFDRVLDDIRDSQVTDDISPRTLLLDRKDIHNIVQLQEYQIVKAQETCDNFCLKCKECNICIHTFKCSCVDNLIKMNICKHIHACAREFFTIPTFNSSPVNEHLHNKEIADLLEMKRINVNVDTNNNMNLIKKIELLSGLVTAVSLSDEDNLAVEKQLDRLIETVNKSKLINLNSKENVNVNKKIDKQKRLCKGQSKNAKDMVLIDNVKSTSDVKNDTNNIRFYSTKKKQQRKQDITKPSVNETNAIISGLLSENSETVDIHHHQASDHNYI